jgi:tRNA pseudouridine38-40 synthase
VPFVSDFIDNPPVIALTVAYDGSLFAGFARQPDAITVQESLETSLATVLRREVHTVGAGRTDAGVHALGQVVSFPCGDETPSSFVLARSLNAMTPGIVVRDVRLARPGFSARFDARSREYRYRIAGSPTPPLFSAPVAWWVKRELDLDAMSRAAETLVGEHDFRSFCVTDSAKGKRTVRRVESIEIAEECILGERCLSIRVVGNAFLHSMVRTIVGSLVEVAVGREDVGWIGDALAACDRSAAGPTAPARGLTLWSVAYPDDVWVDSGAGDSACGGRLAGEA